MKKAQESPEGGVVDQEAVAAAQAKVDAAATTLKTAQADTVSKRAQAEKDAAAVKDAQQAVANAQAAVDAAAADVASAKTAYDQKAEAQAKAQKAYDDAVVANKDWAAEQQRLEKSLADAKAEDAAAQQALKDAQADAAVKSSAYETAKKAYDDAVKNAGDSAKYAQGSFAFFAERGSSDALAILNGTGRYASDVINLKSGVDDGISTGTGDNYEQYRGDKVSSFTHQGDEKDATSLENMKLALDMIKRGNELRAREGLPALKVSDSMMALGQRNANVSAFARNHMQYWSTGENYKVLENLAWGNYGGLTNSDGPYDGWYWQEKANYENKDQTDGFGHTYKPQGTGSVTGHYTAMTDKMTSLGEFKTNQIAGFGVSQYDAVYRTTYSYQFVNADFLAYEKDMSDKYFGGTFQPIDVSDAVDFDTYYSQFMAYYNRVKGVANDSSTLDKLKAQLEAAKKEKEAADQTVSGAQATAGATAAKVSAAQKAADDHANSGSADVVAAKATLDAANQAAASAKVAYDGAAAKKAAADSKLSQGQKALKDAEASAKESASALDVAKSAETAADAALAKATTELEIAKKPSLKPLVDAVEKAKLAQAKATDENATAQAALLVAETELVAARDAQGKAVASEADAKQVKGQADAVVATALGVHDVAQKAYLPSKQVIDTFEAATEADSGAQTGLSVARENKAGADAALTSATVAAQKAKDVASAAAKVAESYKALDPEAAFSNGLYAGAGVDQELVAFVEAKRSAYQKAQADVDSAAADLEEAKAAYGEASAAYQRAAADAKVKEEQLDRVKAAYVATVTPEAAGSGSDIKRNAVAKVALPQTGDDAAAGVVAVAVVGASLITVGGAVALERRRKQN